MDNSIIATRILESGGENYEIQISQPYQSDTLDYVCSWSLLRSKGEVILSQDVYGVDSMQALLLALLVIGARVEAESDEFTHLGIKGTGLLQPVSPGILDFPAWYFPEKA